MSDNKYTVETLNKYIKEKLEGEINELITVEGEISNLKITNGNIFLTLKYKSSSINVTGWSVQKILKNMEVSNGDKIEITGIIYFYTKNGSISLNIKKIEKIGFGDIFQNYELVKNECYKLGYFDNKKIIPNNINNIGIITAPEGAAVQDILFVLKQNKFSGTIVIKRCVVQGVNCPQSVAESIDFFDNWKDKYGNSIDIVLVARGGGSFEDLMGFSDIRVVSSINLCKYFTISAIGHEVDYMLSDYAADLRAPTPSIGAEIIVTQQKKRLDLAKHFRNMIFNDIKEKMLCKIKSLNDRVTKAIISIPHPIHILDSKILDVNNIHCRIKKNIIDNITQYTNNINKLHILLQKYNIDKNINDGYVLIIKNGKMMSSINDLCIGEKLKLKLRDGELDVHINNISNSQTKI